MGITVSTLRDIALRTAVLVGLDMLVWLVVLRSDDTSDANIGAGLFTFAAIAVLSTVGGVYDGIRLGFLRVAVTWVSTAVLTAMLMIALFDPFEPFDFEFFLSDLSETGLFLAAIVAIPALMGGGVGAVLRQDNNPVPSERPNSPVPPGNIA